MYLDSLLPNHRRRATRVAAAAGRSWPSSARFALHRGDKRIERRAGQAGWSLLCSLGAVFAIVAIVLSAHARVAFSQEAGITEYQVKAAFLYNFAKFIEWPAAAFPDRKSPFRLCVLGGEAYLSASSSLNGKSVQGRALEVRGVDSVADARPCHMLFIAMEASSWAEAALEDIGGYTLTVGETSGFTISGGVINLVRVDNRVRFEIARRTGERSGFKFSAQLLKLATLVDHGR